MQAGERQFHLRLDAGGARHPAARGVLGQVVEQGRLAHTGLAMQHQRPAFTDLHDRRDQLVERSAFGVTAGQVRVASGQMHG
ncbi:hypothetical protein GCM10023178_08630 [Actinomadura luteofluorescens]